MHEFERIPQPSTLLVSIGRAEPLRPDGHGGRETRLTPKRRAFGVVHAMRRHGLHAVACLGLLAGCDTSTEGTRQNAHGDEESGSTGNGGLGASGGFGATGYGGTQGGGAGAGGGGDAESGGAAGGGTPSAGASGGGTSARDGVRQIRFLNQCSETIWVGALNAAAEYELPESGGWELAPGGDYLLVLPEHWGGRFWGRTGCQFDSSGAGHCDSGDCGNRLACSGAGGQTPATLAEFTFAGHAGLDFYDVSLVDGYNLPLTIRPVAGTYELRGEGDPYDCGAPGCTSDLNQSCPTELQRKNPQGRVVGCASACEIFQTDAYCCRGSHGTPETCPPFSYSEAFKAACPTAYSYAYDDRTSTYTCFGEDYDVVFCP